MRSIARALLLAPVATALATVAAAGGLVELRLGAVSLGPEGFESASCVQIPVFLLDSEAGRDLRSLRFTIDLSGDVDIIQGGIAAPVLVANGFSDELPTGLTVPGTDLVNINGAPTPSCMLIHNRATANQGDAVDFFDGADNLDLSWSINNDLGSEGRKQGYAIDGIAGNSIATLLMDTPLLVAVLELPIVADPGDALLVVSATPNSIVTGGNAYTWDDNGSSIEHPLDVNDAVGFVQINIDRIFASGFDG